MGGAVRTMYTITSSIYIEFGHHVRGHDGPCISIHGHTWRFEVLVAARELDPQGFVIDFDRLTPEVLTPCHALLDHGLAMAASTWEEIGPDLARIGEKLIATRTQFHGTIGPRQPGLEGQLNGARNEWPGGIKVAVFPFIPTSERLAQWLFEVADSTLRDDRVHIAAARVYESMHPVELVAEYRPQEPRGLT
ncbi:MAG: 6-carboxytetrahydropterin synthase [Myxococcota bacterium]